MSIASGSTPASPRATERPHLVSRVVARRFIDGRHKLARLTIEHRSVREVGVAGFGRAAPIYPQDPLAFEARWKATEDGLHDAFVAVDVGTVFADDRLVDFLKDCLAFHLARGRTVTRVHRRVLLRDRPVLEERLAARPWVDESFRRRHSGLWPAGSEGRRLVAAEMIEEALARLNTTSFTPDRMLALYDRIRPVIARAGLEIGLASEGEFLIGDTPAVSLRGGHPGVGPLGGVPWDRATTIIMPIGRRHMLALGRDPGFVDLDRAAVDYVNWVQVAGADQTVAWHPDANMLGFVNSALDALAAATPPPLPASSSPTVRG